MEQAEHGQVWDTSPGPSGGLQLPKVVDSGVPIPPASGNVKDSELPSLVFLGLAPKTAQSTPDFSEVIFPFTKWPAHHLSLLPLFTYCISCINFLKMKFLAYFFHTTLLPDPKHLILFYGVIRMMVI